MEMAQVVRGLKKGKIAVLATDTLYGILGLASSKRTVERIYRVKGRNERKPFIILISSLGDLKKFGIRLTEKEKKYLQKIWPGSVSVILLCTSTRVQAKLEYLHRGTNSFAFRMPGKKSLLGLLKKTGPLVAPSANPEGQTPAATSTEAEKYFGAKIDFYVPGGRKVGKPSTLISLAGGKMKILRQGSTKVPGAI